MCGNGVVRVYTMQKKIIDMNEYKPKIGIVYLVYYHNESYIDDVVSALTKVTYPKDRLECIIVVNEHPEDGSFVSYIDAHVSPLSEKELPRVTVLPQKGNLGFAGGNTVGSRWAIEHGCDYVFFHNNDGFVASNAFEPLINALESDKTIAIAQSLMLLYPETELANSTGNSFHYLGFGYCDNNRTPLASLTLKPIEEVDYASGSALIIRADLITKYGGWDDDFFMYHEDLEWSFRLRLRGYRIVLVRDSIFYHKYQFSRSIEKFYFMERNRHAVMLMFFRVPTLILLFPIACILEIGLWIFAIKNKYADKRVQVYRYWLQPRNWAMWLRKRRKNQRERVISDRELLKHSVAEIRFQESEMQNPLLMYVGNPIMKLYYYLVVKGLIWW